MKVNGICSEDFDAERSFEKAGFVLLTDVIPDALLEIRYYSTFNFVGERIDSYEAPVACLAESQIRKRSILHQAMIENGFVPQVEEWWHFLLEKEPYLDTYFNFPITMPNRDRS